MSSEMEQLRQELVVAKEEIQEWRNVIAVICCDGGHHHQEHGTRETVEYCIHTVCEYRRQIEQLRMRIEQLRVKIEVLQGLRD